MLPVLAVISAAFVATSMAMEMPPNPAPWPDQFTVLFNVSIPNFKAAELPSVLYYDWTQKRQSIVHQKCPLFQFTQCRVVFSPEGVHVIDTYGISVCCKLADFGTIPPYLFSNFSIWNGTEVVDNVLCNKWNLYDHGFYYTDVETAQPIKFQAVFPDPAGIVWWDFVGPFRPGAPDESVFQIPSLCLPACPVNPTPPEPTTEAPPTQGDSKAEQIEDM